MLSNWPSVEQGAWPRCGPQGLSGGCSQPGAAFPRPAAPSWGNGESHGAPSSLSCDCRAPAARPVEWAPEATHCEIPAGVSPQGEEGGFVTCV